MGAVARARAGRRGRRAPRALPFDHYLSILRGGDAGSLDAWTLLAALAARTERIRLGTLVSPVTFRHPAVLAKAAVTADHISGGRVDRDRRRLDGGRHTVYGSGSGRRASGRTSSTARSPRSCASHRRPRRVAEGAARAAAAPDRRRRRQAADGARGGPLCRRVQHDVRVAGGVSRAAQAGRRRRARGRPRPARVLAMTTCVVGRDARARRAPREAARRHGRDPDRDGTIVGDRPGGRRAAPRVRGAGVERVMLQHLVHEDVEMVAALGDVAAACA